MRTPVIRTIAIPANGTIIERVEGRIFLCISATAVFNVKVFSGAALPMRALRGFGDPEGQDFNHLVFEDTSGSTNTVQFYVGDTPFRITDTQVVSLDSASVSAIGSAVASGGVERTATGPVELTTSATYSDLKYLEVHNTGATDIDVNGQTLAATEHVIFPMLPGGDTYADITVDATGGTAKVIRIA